MRISRNGSMPRRRSRRHWGRGGWQPGMHCNKRTGNEAAQNTEDNASEETTYEQSNHARLLQPFPRRKGKGRVRAEVVVTRGVVAIIRVGDHEMLAGDTRYQRGDTRWLCRRWNWQLCRHERWRLCRRCRRRARLRPRLDVRSETYLWRLSALKLVRLCRR